MQSPHAYAVQPLRCGSCGHTLFTFAIERASPRVYRVHCPNASCPEYGDEYLYDVPIIGLREVPK